MKRRIPVLGHRNVKIHKYDDARRYPFVLSAVLSTGEKGGRFRRTGQKHQKPYYTL